MRKKKSGLPALILLLLTITALFVGSLQALAEPSDKDAAIKDARWKGIYFEVTGGFDGMAKLGAWSPIHVKIYAPGRNISGEIQVEANLDQARRIILAKPIQLIDGEMQEFYFEIPVVSAKRSIQVRLVEGKKTLAEEEFSFKRLLPPEIMLIGVLSDDPEAFGFLNGNTVPVAMGAAYDEKMKTMIAAGVAAMPVPDIAQEYQKRQAVVVSLDRNSFPEKSEVLDGFDFLLINQFDTSLLSETQLSTLENWVNTGGVLMLGTGMNWQKVYHGLPESLKPFHISNTADVSCDTLLQGFTERIASGLTLRLARGDLGFEYIPVFSENEYYKPGEPTRWFDNDIVVGDANNPLVLKYGKEMGSIFVFTFDPAAEPFVSWLGKNIFFENIFKHIGSNIQRFYEWSSGYYFKQQYSSSNLQYLATEVPSDKKPPFLLMFITLGIYIILAGPVLYIILKHRDKRDLAWICIPALSVLFLAGMYVFGFKSRYHSAVMNTVSLIQATDGGNEARVSSSIGLFNDRRGTLKLQYASNNGLNTPFIQNNNDMYYRSYGDNVEGSVVAKYSISEPVVFEQYDVMLWTPTILNAEKTIPFGAELLKDIYLKDGMLMGHIANTTPYDLLDTAILVGTNIIPVGDILANETREVSIAFNSKEVYKRPDEYLDKVFGRTYYNNPKDIPPNYAQNMQRRRIFENYINEIYNMQMGRTGFVLLARNSQIIDYGVTVNDKKPQMYNQNLIRVDSEFSFEPGREVEIPGGIIMASMYQSKEVGWQEGNNSIRIYNTGDLEFRFSLPEKLTVTGFGLSVENYIPLYIRYNMENNQNNGYQTQILSNKYEYTLYNVKTGKWDAIESITEVNQDPYRYIGLGNEVRMKITVVELVQPELDVEYSNSIYTQYERAYLSMPEITVRGVAK